MDRTLSYADVSLKNEHCREPYGDGAGSRKIFFAGLVVCVGAFSAGRHGTGRGQ